jgi:hypothetical protein
MDEDLAVFKPYGGDLVVNLLEKDEKARRR